MARQCRDRDIKIEPAKGRVEVSLHGRKIIAASSALALKEGGYPAVYYVPRDTLPAKIVVASDHRTACPFKGTASYLHLKSGDVLAENPVWYYPQPCPQVAAIAGHVAFWGDAVDVRFQPGSP